MPVIAIASAKGGTGKTTLSAELAVTARRNGYRVGLIDLDPQQSLTSWWDRRARNEDADVEGLDTFDMPERVSVGAHAEAVQDAGAAIVIIDCPPGDIDLLKAAIVAADAVLIPTGASAFEIEQLPVVVETAKRARKGHLIVLTRVEDVDMTHEAFALIEEEFGPIAREMISSRPSVPEAQGFGLTGCERDVIVKREVENLWDEAKSLFAKPAAATPRGVARYYSRRGGNAQ